MQDLPYWLSTEDQVRQYFQLLGFVVDSVSIEGRQIDLTASRLDQMTGEQELYAIEITTERVGAGKGSKDCQKLLLYKARNTQAKLMIVSTAGFTDDQAASLRTLGVIPRRLIDLEESALSLQRYALSAQRELSSSQAPDIGYHPAFYVQPRVTIEGAKSSVLEGKDWTHLTVDNPEAGICAVLGSLGSGKTSLLKSALDYSLKRFLADPDQKPVPLYVPLGRYKQHAGDLSQMLMSELARAGIGNYPAALMSFLISQRRVILFLDGLDEIHPIQNAEDTLQTVDSIVKSVGSSATAVISCRKQFFESSDEEQAYFGSFTAGHLKSLNIGLQKALRGSPQTHIIRVLPFNADQIKRYLEVRCGLTAEATDALLRQYYGFAELASTPVLLAMIATTVVEGILPTDKSLAFPHVALYDAYTTRWIERDLGRARLSATQRSHFSEHLADQMLWRSLDSATWIELSNVLRENPEWGNNPLTPDEAELDIRNSGFLIRELDDTWRFVHRSILEFFAAKAELARLLVGERPRHVPTDGYKIFLLELIAQHWSENGMSVFPPTTWTRSRGRDVRLNQWSILAAASNLLPNGSKAELTEVGDVEVSVDINWSFVSFKRVRIFLLAATLTFNNCRFDDCTITLEDGENALVEFKDCKFYNTVIIFNVFPDWISSYDANDPQAVDVPAAVYRFASYVDAGARIRVNDVDWVLGEQSLDVFLDCARRLKGKTFVHNFVRGTHADTLGSLIPKLTKAGLLHEDKSRQGHQLDWTPLGRTLVAKLRNSPVEAQVEIYNLFA